MASSQHSPDESAKESDRPTPQKHRSAPPRQNPRRRARWNGSNNSGYKETLNAHSEYSNSEESGAAQHRINQYTVKEEIGRGSCGFVHIAEDQYGQKYAIKEFSKSRLRKREQSNMLRKPRRQRNRISFNQDDYSPMHRHQTQSELGRQAVHPLDLIKEEIAIMKKVNHVNLVHLLEVLDDPDEDSLYMVVDYCKKGVVMKVELDGRVDPYDEPTCRFWFKQMILGIEYLHMQGILHRDIKPDNCLVTEEGDLKITDFGVSEMFNKGQDMTDKSAGSPAFMPPELCVAKHGEVSGRAADIWSMGVTLYCLRFGKIPFFKPGLLEMFESIRNDEADLGGEDVQESFKDMMKKILEKDPQKRIEMDELRKHPWVTNNDTEPLISKKKNISDPIEPPTEEEVDAAITGNMKHLLVVVKAVKRFKERLYKKRPELREGILGKASRFVQPPSSMRPYKVSKSKSMNVDDREPVESKLAGHGTHRQIGDTEILDADPAPSSASHTHAINATSSILSGEDAQCASPHTTSTTNSSTCDSPCSDQSGSSTPSPSHSQSQKPSFDSSGKGHARNPLLDHLFLDIGDGPSSSGTRPDGTKVVCESPAAAEENVYERAYKEEVEHILQTKGESATLFLTRRVEGKDEFEDMEGVVSWEDGAVREVMDEGDEIGVTKGVGREGKNKKERKDGSAGDQKAGSDASTGGQAGDTEGKGPKASAKQKLQGALGKITS